MASGTSERKKQTAAAEPAVETPSLQVSNLQVQFATDLGQVYAVNDISFHVNKGEAIAIVGESGCGKSVTAHSILQLMPDNAQVKQGRIDLKMSDDRIENILDYPQDGRMMRHIRGGEVGMIFQEPMTALSPVHTIGNQLCEPLLLHRNVTKEQARSRAIELLGQVGIAHPEQRIDEYTFQLSGGMRQRAMIAMALACNPRVLIADEPTTALDVTIQAQVLQLIKQLQQEYKVGLILITHDLGVVAHMVERVYVFYLGHVVETAPVNELFKHPRHPYTQDLLASIPLLHGETKRLNPIKGAVPDAYSIPHGCPFHPRCRHAMDVCCEQFPAATEEGEQHKFWCHLYSGGNAEDHATKAAGLQHCGEES